MNMLMHIQTSCYYLQDVCFFSLPLFPRIYYAANIKLPPARNADRCKSPAAAPGLHSRSRYHFPSESSAKPLSLSHEINR
jgi:hypothetical protein